MSDTPRGPPAASHQAASPGTNATADRSSDHTAASPRRSHQVSTTAAPTWAAVACGVNAWAWVSVIRMPCMTIATWCGWAA
jgi:hypothetical protein